MSSEDSINNSEKIPANGIANSGTTVMLIAATLPRPTKRLPVKSPNLVTKVSINTVDLYLSFFFSWL